MVIKHFHIYKLPNSNAPYVAQWDNERGSIRRAFQNLDALVKALPGDIAVYARREKHLTFLKNKVPKGVKGEKLEDWVFGRVSRYVGYETERILQEPPCLTDKVRTVFEALYDIYHGVTQSRKP